MSWKDTIKKAPFKDGKYRSTPQEREKAKMEADKIMRERHGKKYIDSTKNISPRLSSTYGAEYMHLASLIGDKGMSPTLAAKQPYVPKEPLDDSEDFKKKRQMN